MSYGHGIRADKIVAYTYQAANYCPSCMARMFGSTTPDSRPTQSAESLLDSAARDWEIDRYDESSYDSGHFPKVVFADQTEDDEACDSCGEVFV